MGSMPPGPPAVANGKASSLSEYCLWQRRRFEWLSLNDDSIAIPLVLNGNTGRFTRPRQQRAAFQSSRVVDAIPQAAFVCLRVQGEYHGARTSPQLFPVAFVVWWPEPLRYFILLDDLEDFGGLLSWEECSLLAPRIHENERPRHPAARLENDRGLGRHHP